VILVCGEALVDSVTNADGTQRLMPGGGPFNTARALARLGVPTAFLGHISNDALGHRLAELLVADGASLALATFGSEPTTLAVAEVDGAGLAEYEFFVEGTSAPHLTPEMIPDHLPRDIAALHVGTLGLVLEPMASTLADLVDREGPQRLVMLDTNVRPSLVSDNLEYRDRLMRLMGQSTIVKASEADLQWLNPDMGYEGAADQILKGGARLVLVTLGSQGAFGIGQNLRVTVEAPPVDVVDTIGAGDAFNAGFLAWLHDHDRISANLNLEMEELRAALEFACLAASLTCAKAGAEPPTRKEMERAHESAVGD
jgi:fructokinase